MARLVHRYTTDFSGHGVGFQKDIIRDILLGRFLPLRAAVREAMGKAALQEAVGDLIRFELQWLNIMPRDIFEATDYAVTEGLATLAEMEE